MGLSASNTKPFIAAFDIATATGVCHGRPGCAPAVWTWHLDDGGKSRAYRLCYFRRLCDEYFHSTEIDAVYYEEPVRMGAMMHIGASDATITLLRGAIGVLGGVRDPCRHSDGRGGSGAEGAASTDRARHLFQGRGQEHGQRGGHADGQNARVSRPRTTTQRGTPMRFGSTPVRFTIRAWPISANRYFWGEPNEMTTWDDKPNTSAEER